MPIISDPAVYDFNVSEIRRVQAENRRRGRASDWAEQEFGQCYGPPIRAIEVCEWDSVTLDLPSIPPQRRHTSVAPRPLGQRVMYVLHLFSGRRREEDLQFYFEQAFQRQ